MAKAFSTPIDLIKHAVLRRDAEFHDYPPPARVNDSAAPSDFIIVGPEDKPDPDALFPFLRWGGQVVYASWNKEDVRRVMTQFVEREYVVSRGPGKVGPGFFGMSIPFLGRKAHYVILRKMLLTLPREVSERFTYSVKLSIGRDGTPIVQKEIPSTERIIARLKHKFPDMAEEQLVKSAKKFTGKIFPLFLTREAGMLKVLQKHLPPEYACRVPTLLDFEQDQDGKVKRLWMNWLRNGGEPITQMQFALQSADLLRALHDLANVIHLDLRPDNMVVTKDGVGFVDFGSAVRGDENLSENPLLKKLMDDLMRTSEIQRTMGRMIDSGLLTSPVIGRSFQKVDKSVDLFYLSLQMREPLGNPDLRGLIKFDPTSPQAKAISAITEEVLRPKDPAAPTYATAADLLAGLKNLNGGA